MTQTIQSYSVPEIVEIATALEKAGSVAAGQGITSIDAQDEWEAILKILAYHPEWPTIGGFIKYCIKALREARDEK